MQGRRCNPSWGTTKGIEQKIVREFGHGELQVLGLVVEDSNGEPADVRAVVLGSGHGATSERNAGHRFPRSTPVSSGMQPSWNQRRI